MIREGALPPSQSNPTDATNSLRWLGRDTRTSTVRWPLNLTAGWPRLHAGQTEAKYTQPANLNDQTNWSPLVWFCRDIVVLFRERSTPTPLTARRPALRSGWIWGHMNNNQSVWKFWSMQWEHGVKTTWCCFEKYPESSITYTGKACLAFQHNNTSRDAQYDSSEQYP